MVPATSPSPRRRGRSVSPATGGRARSQSKSRVRKTRSSVYFEQKPTRFTAPTVGDDPKTNYDAEDNDNDNDNDDGDGELSRKASFLPRWSILDRECLDENHLQTPVRGFLALFWIVVSLYVVISMYKNSTSHYMGVSLLLLKNSYREWEALVVMVVAIYLYTYICLPYQWLLLTHRLDSSNQRARLATRLVLQNIPILAALFVARFKDWPHLQTGSLLLFSMSMNMKMHSFLSTNESLDIIYQDAHLRRPRSSSNVARNRRKSTRSSQLCYPQNLTIPHFTLFLWFPTLIYELNYPRTPRIRWSYMVERTLGVVVIVCLFYVVLSHYVHPVLLQAENRPWLDSFVDLLLPCAVSALLIFFLIFEYLLNWAAELTRFADRKFYADWWNSTDMAEFARKWNIPVHRFLRYHVYTMMRRGWGSGRLGAQTITFLYSSLLHELVVSATAKRLRCYIFFMQMSQIPLMYAARILRLKKLPFLANIIWWLMILLGLPVLVLLYSLR